MRISPVLPALLSVLLCSAAPPGKDETPISPFSEELKEENFVSRTSSGIWCVPPSRDMADQRFIKHYSPYCKHCLELAPVWNEIAEKSQEYAGRLNFGAVDCVANGDICNDNDIKAFPVMQWYPFLITRLSQVGRREKGRRIPLQGSTRL